jgi:hypothetical protein
MRARAHMHPHSHSLSPFLLYAVSFIPPGTTWAALLVLLMLSSFGQGAAYLSAFKTSLQVRKSFQKFPVVSSFSFSI